MVSRVTTSGNYSAVLTNLLAAQQRQAEANARQAILETPLVRAAFDHFPEAELHSYGAQT